MKLPFAAVLVGIAATMSGIAAADPPMLSLTVIPASPRYLEPVYLRLAPPELSNVIIYGAQVSMDGTNIVVQYQSYSELGQPAFDVMLGRLPTGTYSVKVLAPAGSITTQFTVSAPTLPTAPCSNVPPVNYTDLWWSKSESGWGLSVTQGPTNEVVATWFVYDLSGNPVWYSMQPGSWKCGLEYEGPIYKTGNAPVPGAFGGYAGTFDFAHVSAAQVGTGTLAFQNATTGVFAYTVNGVTGFKNISRMPME